jgi:hypothetical protein
MRIFVENNERPEILDRVADLGFAVFDSDKDYDLNIIGERNPNGQVDKFDDYINVVFKIDGIWNWYVYRCTTDAGKWYWKTTATQPEQQYCVILSKCGVYTKLICTGEATRLCVSATAPSSVGATRIAIPSTTWKERSTKAGSELICTNRVRILLWSVAGRQVAVSSRTARISKSLWTYVGHKLLIQVGTLSRIL